MERERERNGSLLISRMNCDVYRATLSAQIHPNSAKLIGQCFIMKTDLKNDCNCNSC